MTKKGPVFGLQKVGKSTRAEMGLSSMSFQQGDVVCNQGPRPTKLLDCMGYRAWSALRTCSILHCLWQPAKPRTGMSIFQQFYLPNLNLSIWFLLSLPVRLSQSNWAASEPVGPSSKDKERLSGSILMSSHPIFSCQVYWSVFARTMHSTSKIW